jgi:Tfp pilus assembly protein PilF
MFKIVLIVSLFLGGCSSSSNLTELSKNNIKTGRYYESIGQPQAAQREYKAAAKHQKQSNESEAILFDILWSLLLGD